MTPFLSDLRSLLATLGGAMIILVLIWTIVRFLTLAKRQERLNHRLHQLMAAVDDTRGLNSRTIGQILGLRLRAVERLLQQQFDRNEIRRMPRGGVMVYFTIGQD